MRAGLLAAQNSLDVESSTPSSCCAAMCVLISTVLQKDCNWGMQGLFGPGDTLHDAQAPQKLLHICCRSSPGLIGSLWECYTYWVAYSYYQQLLDSICSCWQGMYPVYNSLLNVLIMYSVCNLSVYVKQYISTSPSLWQSWRKQSKTFSTVSRLTEFALTTAEHQTNQTELAANRKKCKTNSDDLIVRDKCP